LYKAVIRQRRQDLSSLIDAIVRSRGSWWNGDIVVVVVVVVVAGGVSKSMAMLTPGLIASVGRR
jgi:hypothetical protein